MAQDQFKRKLTTIFSADVTGYSHLMGEDEAATVKTLELYKGLMAELIRQHRGRVVDSPGDNLLAEFTSVVDAVQCAVATQKELQARSAELPENRLWRRKRVFAAALAVLVLIIGVPFWNFYFSRPSIEPASEEKMAFPLPDVPAIAVLPFVNMSEDKNQEYFSDGLTEEIITALSKTSKLFVIARNSTFVFKGKPVNVQRISRELGVKYVLEGSVRSSGDQLRMTAQLIDALTGNHLWAERYVRNLKDIFAVQDEITKKIFTALQVELTEGEQARVYARGTNSLEAYLKTLHAAAVGRRLNRY